MFNSDYFKFTIEPISERITKISQHLAKKTGKSLRSLTHSVQSGPRKVKPTTILLVTFECVGKIQ